MERLLSESIAESAGMDMVDGSQHEMPGMRECGSATYRH